MNANAADTITTNNLSGMGNAAGIGFYSTRSHTGGSEPYVDYWSSAAEAISFAREESKWGNTVRAEVFFCGTRLRTYIDGDLMGYYSDKFSRY